MASFLPEADGALATWAINFGTMISTTPTNYGLTQAQADAYDEVRVEYVSRYQIANDPTTRTAPAIAFKNDARTALKAKSREFARIIEACPIVTDGQRVMLGLTVRKQPTPVPAPSVRPGVDMGPVNGRTVAIHIHDSDSASKRGKPAGVLAAWVYSYVGADYPSDPSLWDFQGAATKAKLDIVFPSDLPAGTQVWVCAAWVNAKQQTGPVSVPITTNLQGGGASAPANLKIAA